MLPKILHHAFGNEATDSRYTADTLREEYTFKLLVTTDLLIQFYSVSLAF